MSRLQLRRVRLSHLPGQRRRSRSFSRPPSRRRPAPPRLAAPLTRSPSGGRVRPLARSPARRPIGVRAPETPTDAGPRSSGPALCDTAYQSLISAADSLQSAREGRGLAFRDWRLLGRRGRTGILEELSVRRGPDVDSLLLIAGAVWGKAGDWRRPSFWEEPAPE